MHGCFGSLAGLAKPCPSPAVVRRLLGPFGTCWHFCFPCLGWLFLRDLPRNPAPALGDHGWASTVAPF